MMPTLSILLLGNTQRSEFCEVRATLENAGRVTEAANVASATAILAAGKCVPDLIIVAQAFPGEFSREAIDELRRQAPLARVVGLLGSWCEGELRSGQPWPAAIRTYWHQWPQRWGRQVTRLMCGECPTWGLPATATDEERLLLEADADRPQREGLVVIYAQAFEMADWLSAACRSRGYATVWLRPRRPARTEGAKAAIFDATDLQGDELAELKRLVAKLDPAPVIVLLDFPRREDSDRAKAAGAAAVLSKPLQIDDLFWQLGRTCNTCRS
jgi:DNA-binding NarL/FixJ family response regulator